MSTTTIPATPEERAAFVDALLEVAPTAAIELVSAKAAKHDFVWLDAALQSRYVRTSIEAGSGEGCRFIYAGVPRFTAIAHAVRTGIGPGQTYEPDDGPPTPQINVSEFGQRLAGFVSEFDAYYKEFASFDNPGPTAMVLMSCAAAIGRVDLIARLGKMSHKQDLNSKIKGGILDGLSDKVESVAPAGIALCFGQMAALDALIAIGWDPKEKVAYQRRGPPAKSVPIGVIEFCVEVANQPALLAGVIERVRESRDGELQADETNYLKTVADECITGMHRLPGEYLDALIKIGHFDDQDPQNLIARSIRNGCLPLLEYLKPHLNPAAVADEETKATSLHLAITEDSIPIVNRVDMVEMLCATGLTLDTLDGEGYPALHRAIHQRSESLVQMLLLAGADHRLKNAVGRDALEEAQEMKLGGESCAQIILALRAQDRVSAVIDRARVDRDNGSTP
jgi:hypothetical protein